MLTPRPHQHRQEPGNHLPKVPGVLHPSRVLVGGQILAPRPSPTPPRQISISRSEAQAPSCLYMKKMTWVPRVTQQVKSYHVCCSGPISGAPAWGLEGLCRWSSLFSGLCLEVPRLRFPGEDDLGGLPAPPFPGLHPVSQRGPGGADPHVRAPTVSL